MRKFEAATILLIISPLLGAAYGFLHDQLTYCISEEYYTKFKFIQFGFEYMGIGKNVGTEDLPIIQMNHPRLGAGLVGVLATWWMGSVIGIFLIIAGLFHKTGKQMFKSTIKSFKYTAATALLFGFVGLIYGFAILDGNAPLWSIPPSLNDRNSFIAVGSMHNFSYAGGFIGLIIGLINSFYTKARMDKESISIKRI